MKAPLLIPLLFVAIPAWGQFQLNLVDGGTERSAPALYDYGGVYSGESVSAHFRLRNVSAGGATLSVLAVAGTGFTLSAPPLPLTLDPQAALDFTVAFRGAERGSYSAVLRSEGVTILLVAAVVPGLTWRVDSGFGLVPLAGPVDFGSVVRGSAVQRRFTLANETPQILTVPQISVQGADFSLAALPPSGQAYLPQQTGEFTVVFTAHAAGVSQGTLILGDRSYTLSGAGTEPPPPRPLIAIDLQQMASAQQGVAIVRFDRAVAATVSGSLTLDFRGPADPTVAFASGGRTAAFTVAPGDTQVSFPFQTGTTAGTLAFTAQIGSASDQLRVAIPAAPAAVAAALGARASGSVEISVTGYDNTRTLGPLAFTFYDSAGTSLAPGAIRADATADFAKFFPASDLGGAFVLRAVFPVTGDISRIASCDVTLTNSSGDTRTPRVAF